MITGIMFEAKMKRKIIDLCILTFVIYMTLCCLLGGGFFLPNPRF